MYALGVMRCPGARDGWVVAIKVVVCAGMSGDGEMARYGGRYG